MTFFDALKFDLYDTKIPHLLIVIYAPSYQTPLSLAGPSDEFASPTSEPSVPL